MKLSFKVDYQTLWGQALFLAGSVSEFGSWDPANAVKMHSDVPGEWEATCTVSPGLAFEYKYLVKDEKGNIIWEGGHNRLFDPGGIFDEIRCRDFWRAPREVDTVLNASAFHKVLLRRDTSADSSARSNPYDKTLRVQIFVPRVSPDCRVGMLGNLPALGTWMEEDTVLMDDGRFPLWRVDLDADKLKFPFQFKYVIYNTVTKKVITWEQGSNRMIRDFVCKEPISMKIHTDESFRFPVSHWRGAGVAVPVFSLRTEKSGGIGEFPDLKKLIDWAKLTGLKLIQLLPLNETIATHSWSDTYPYKFISAHALHPVYLNINKMGILEDENLMSGFAQAMAGFNALDTVHYDEVHKIKSKFFKLIFAQQKDLFLKDPGFLAFFGGNREWLEPYAAFCFLRDKHKTSNFRLWPEYQVCNSQTLSELCAVDGEHYHDIALYYFIQYHAHKQLIEVTEYARKQRVVLMGNLSLGISRNSVEAWTQPELFHSDQQAGTPPDEYADLGQNWGFPTYNWEKMAREHFSWWEKRLSHLTEYFDALRIDHIVSFFRIWEIPLNQVQGIMGHFKPALPYTSDEIIDKGINFNVERYTKPYIRDYFLWELFGEDTEEVKLKYLTEYDQGRYNLKSAFDNQRKVWDYFEQNAKGEELSGRESRIRDGLCALIAEVIFIRDPCHHTLYHPRVAFHNTNSYLNLPHEVRYALDDLYIDFFYQRHEAFWEKEGRQILPVLLSASGLLTYGDDLGMVPECVAKVMHELGILGLEIQRMPKNPKMEFAHPADAPYLSVCATSTHEMSTLRGWWEEDPLHSERFFRQVMGYTGEFPASMTPGIARDILAMHLSSPAMWAIFPIQDLLAMDGRLRWDNKEGERTNMPAIAHHYWRYRMHLKLEDLMTDTKLNTDLFNMISASGRGTDS